MAQFINIPALQRTWTSARSKQAYHRLLQIIYDPWRDSYIYTQIAKSLKFDWRPKLIIEKIKTISWCHLFYAKMCIMVDY